ncbi:hypothetical protein GCM10023405_25200 [Streptomonospora salina]
MLARIGGVAAEFAPGKTAATSDELVRAQGDQDTGHSREVARLKDTIAECDRKLGKPAPPPL